VVAPIDAILRLAMAVIERSRPPSESRVVVGERWRRAGLAVVPAAVGGRAAVTCGLAATTCGLAVATGVWIRCVARAKCQTVGCASE
jgi:hypothetical protein